MNPLSLVLWEFIVLVPSLFCVPFQRCSLESEDCDASHSHPYTHTDFQCILDSSEWLSLIKPTVVRDIHIYKHILLIWTNAVSWFSPAAIDFCILLNFYDSFLWIEFLHISTLIADEEKIVLKAIAVELSGDETAFWYPPGSEMLSWLLNLESLLLWHGPN